MDQAYHCVSSLVAGDKRQTPKVLEDYLNLARQFPSLIHTSGALQAVMFLRKKAGGGRQEGGKSSAHDKSDAGTLLLEHLQRMLSEARVSFDKWDDIARCPLDQYLRFTRCAMQSAEWLKRYSEVLIEPLVEQKGPGKEGA
ncbi:MAG: type III-B CRISPR module-associated protein Cmr5 [Thermoflavifilum sp.]|nr:type III-B CRISPR module-associated protein Cmr5 [Thermoflavifilum sp.]MCL6515185.1 type III-B CRISPR module-associated protein Cmr5 [Alicyclobacillus sp.]